MTNQVYMQDQLIVYFQHIFAIRLHVYMPFQINAKENCNFKHMNYMYMLYF